MQITKFIVYIQHHVEYLPKNYFLKFQLGEGVGELWFGDSYVKNNRVRTSKTCLKFTYLSWISISRSIWGKKRVTFTTICSSTPMRNERIIISITAIVIRIVTMWCFNNKISRTGLIWSILYSIKTLTTIRRLGTVFYYRFKYYRLEVTATWLRIKCFNNI